MITTMKIKIKKNFRVENLRAFVMVTVLAVCSLGLWLVPQPLPVAQTIGKPCKAQVVSTDDSLVQQHGFVKYGTQRLKVKLLSGGREGAVFQAANELRAQMEYDKVFKPGDKALVIVPPEADEKDSVLVARDYWRLDWMAALAIAFCVLLCVFGGWTGARSLFSLLFSCLVIWKLVVPLSLKGYPVSWITFASVCFLTAVIMYLVAGWTRKGLTAFLGANLGVLSGLALAHVFTVLTHVDGTTLPYAQTLIFSGYEFLNLSDVFIGAMILGSAGAVMDLAMDIAVGIDEVVRHNPELTSKQLLFSGLRIGRSIVGTMTTTLLLAYAGGYITLLMMFSAQGTKPVDFINSTVVSAEIVKTLIGCFSLVLVAPFTAVVASRILVRK